LGLRDRGILATWDLGIGVWGQFGGGDRNRRTVWGGLFGLLWREGWGYGGSLERAIRAVRGTWDLGIGLFGVLGTWG
jgi:hypothetical protein